MVGIILCIVVNHVVGLVILFNLPEFEKLNSLSKEMQSPENSEKIKEAVKLFVPLLIPTVIFGAVGLAAVVAFWFVRAAWWKFTEVVGNMREIARRYGKAKRGYGVKTEQEEIDEEALLVEQELERQSSNS